MSAAMLVIDMQNDFCTRGGFFDLVAGLDITHGERIISRIHALTATARSRGVPLIYTRSVRRDPPLQALLPERPFYFAGGRPIVQQDAHEPLTWGSEITDRLTPSAEDRVIDKPRYSAFFNTDLEEILRALGVDTVVLTGMTSNCCIDSTMRDAYFRDFSVVVVSDCIAGFGGEEHLHQATLENARLVFGVVRTADELERSEILIGPRDKPEISAAKGGRRVATPQEPDA